MLKNREIKRQPDKKQVKQILYWCCILLIWVFILLIYLRQPLKRVKLENEIYKFNKNLIQIKETNLRLRVEKQSLLALSKVKERAKLIAPDFQKPQKGQLVWVGVKKTETKSQ